MDCLENGSNVLPWKNVGTELHANRNSVFNWLFYVTGSDTAK